MPRPKLCKPCFRAHDRAWLLAKAIRSSLTSAQFDQQSSSFEVATHRYSRHRAGAAHLLSIYLTVLVERYGSRRIIALVRHAPMNRCRALALGRYRRRMERR